MPTQSNLVPFGRSRIIYLLLLTLPPALSTMAEPAGVRPDHNASYSGSDAMAKRKADSVLGGSYFVTTVSVVDVTHGDDGQPLAVHPVQISLEGESITGQRFDVTVGLRPELLVDIASQILARATADLNRR